MGDRRLVAGLLGIALLTFVVFRLCLGHDFVNWDDNINILSNQDVILFDLLGLMTSTVNNIYVPIALLSHAIEYQLFGFDPFWFHFDNIALHAFNSCMTSLFLARLFPGRTFVALVGGALFAVHPLQVENVAWVTGRKDLLCYMFYLGALATYLDARQRSSRASYFLALGLSLAALFAKPTAMTLPVVLLMSDMCFVSGKLRAKFFTALPFFVMVVPFGILNLNIQAPGVDFQHLSIYQMDLLERAWVGATAIVFYLSKYFLPTHLSIYYDIDLVRVEPLRWALAAAAMLFAAVWLWRRPADRAVGFWGILFFAVTIAPTTKIIAFGEFSVFNERYLYIPMLGLIVATLLPLRAAMEAAKAQRFAVAIGIATLVVLSLRSYERSKVWRDSGTLWSDVLVKYPGTPVAHNQLGDFYLEKDDFDRAFDSFEAAVARRPSFARPYERIGMILADRGETERAAVAYERHVAESNGNPLALVLAAGFYLENENPRSAAKHLREAVRISPASVGAHSNLGVAYLRLRWFRKAEVSFKNALRIDPELAVVHANLGEVYFSLREFDRALKCFEEAQRRGYPVDTLRLEMLRESVVP